MGDLVLLENEEALFQDCNGQDRLCYEAQLTAHSKEIGIFGSSRFCVFRGISEKATRDSDLGTALLGDDDVINRSRMEMNHDRKTWSRSSRRWIEANLHTSFCYVGIVPKKVR
jgi:hypothetical protein